MPPRVTTDPPGAPKTNCAAWPDSKVCSDVTVTARGSATREVLRNSEETAPSFRASNCAMLAVPQGLSDTIVALFIRYCQTHACASLFRLTQRQLGPSDFELEFFMRLLRALLSACRRETCRGGKAWPPAPQYVRLIIQYYSWP